MQSGEIVKGGRQDRVLVSSLVLPPRSGRVSLAAFCVEHGRWSARSGEAGDTFASAEAALPSREAKLAMKAPPSDAASMDGDTGTRQERIWSGVADIQSRLSASLAADVASPRSESSLQLSLENEKLTGAVEKYVTALHAAAREGDRCRRLCVCRQRQAEQRRPLPVECAVPQDVGETAPRQRHRGDRRCRCDLVRRNPADRRRRDGISRDIGGRRRPARPPSTTQPSSKPATAAWRRTSRRAHPLLR